ncbi:11622_t:CDS:2 [Entrophospora sp. SA101]|nr:11622_t:CDS:2 [Entrophospora sp. SA101]
MLIELLALLAVVPTGLLAFYIWLLQSRKGTLEITTTECAYDKSRFGHILNWDKHCLYIHGRPTIIVSGEFHYWRLPDKSRWESILKKYCAGGFNCIRIYFHWGFHSPDEGVYKFDDNRDVEYLLNLCEKLNLYVLAAPGPYICAETQAGGFPIWLVEKADKLRHVKFTTFKQYDENFSEYQREWFENILPILAKHQITEKSNGCIIALQVENELFELVKIIPFGLHDELRFLCKVARNCGISVPLFTNDGDESGSFIAKPELDAKPSTHFFNRRTFGLDLYGFDKYIVFVPPSAPVPWTFYDEQDPSKWKQWDPKDFMNSIDKLEKTIRGFGYDAKLQGGWFTSYKLKHTFDDVYNFYVEWSNKSNQTTDNDSSLLQPFKKKILTNEPRHLSIKKGHKTPQNSKIDSDSDSDDHDHDTFSNDVINASNEEKSNSEMINNQIDSGPDVLSNNDDIFEGFGNELNNGDSGGDNGSEIQMFHGDDDSSDLNHYFLEESNEDSATTATFNLVGNGETIDDDDETILNIQQDNVDDNQAHSNNIASGKSEEMKNILRNIEKSTQKIQNQQFKSNQEIHYIERSLESFENELNSTYGD